MPTSKVLCVQGGLQFVTTNLLRAEERCPQLQLRGKDLIKVS